MTDFVSGKAAIAGPEPWQCQLTWELTKTLRIMKLTAILLFAAALQVSAKGVAQEKINLSMSNASLEKVFDQIESQTGFVFIYKDETVKDKKVNIQVINATLTQTLDICLKGQALSYKIVGKSVAIKPESVIAALTAANAPPLIDVRGRVVNEKGDPVEGVTVTVKGSTQKTMTDKNGEFSMATVEQDAVLVFTHVSMEAFELKVSGKTELLVNLKTKVSELGGVEIIVNTGYQEIPKERATGSFYKIDNELFSRKISTDIIRRLENVTSGFQIYQNQLSVRGRSTIFANQNPLIVVDNFPYDGDINNLNPNDIESVTVLKDASAASIWGAFSGNGVIVIKTKSGKFNQPTTISITSNLTVGNKPDLFYNKAFLGSSDFIDVEQFLFQKGYYDALLNNTVTYPSVSPVVEILGKQRAGTITSAEAMTQINSLKNIDVRNEVLEHFYQKSINQQYALNVAGGNAKAFYYMSAGYDKVRSMQVANNNDRLTFNIQSTFKPINNLELSGGINYNQSSQDIDNTLLQATTDIAAGHNIYPYARFADNDGYSLPIPKSLSTNYIRAMQTKGLLDWSYVPLNELGLNKNTAKNYDTRLNAGVKLKIVKGFSLDVKYQYFKSIGEREELFYENSFYVRDLVNRYTVINSNGTLKRNIPLGAILNNYYSNLTSNSARAQLNFDKRFGKHSITAITGIDIRESRTKSNASGVYGYDINTLASSSVNYDTLYAIQPTGADYVPRVGYIRGTLNRFRSYFSNVAYTYNNRYTLSVSGRIDQSNFFGYKANQRSVPLWSAGVKWDISKEIFYHINFLPDVSIRATYGYNGNLDKTATPLTLAYYSPVPGGIANLYYARINSPANPELTWERIGMLNIGLDFGIVGNKVSGSIEYFTKRGRNMIGDELIDPSTGFNSVTGNFTDMRGKGFDLILNSKNIDQVFKWGSTFLFSNSTNKVTRYNGTSYLATIVEGKPVESLYANRWGGLDPATGNPRGYLNDTLSTNWAAINNLPTKEKVFMGSYVPTIFGSLLNTFSYGNIALSINVSYKLKYSFLRPSINYGLLFGTWVGHSDYQKRWQKTGDEATTTVPSMIYPSNSSRDYFYNTSEVLVEKGDHIRLEDIRLTYTLDRTTLKKLPLQNIDTYIYLNNIGVIWQANKNGIDPNYKNGYLPPRSFAIGIKATL